MKKTILTLSLLLAPVGLTAYAQDTSTSTTETTTTTETTPMDTTGTGTTETTGTDTNVQNDAVTTSTEADGVAGNEKEPARFPWGLLGLLGLAGLMGRSRPAPVVHTTTTHTEPRRETVVTGTTQVKQNDTTRR